MRFLAKFALILLPGFMFAQNPITAPDSGTASTSAQSKDQPDAGEPDPPKNSNPPAAQPAPPALNQQPKRILGMMPNYRAVSAGVIPPPPTAKEAFKIATENSFDYSAFLFVGITSLMAWGTDAHPQLRSGIAGYGRYYWRGFLDKADGNYLVIFALPTIFHEDERYYAMGQGGIWKRGIYAASRILITPNYHGHNTLNISELLGRGMAQGISTAYYPSQDRTAGEVMTKLAFALGRDALTNVFREFWPDIDRRVLHRHSSAAAAKTTP